MAFSVKSFFSSLRPSLILLSSFLKFCVQQPTSNKKRIVNLEKKDPVYNKRISTEASLNITCNIVQQLQSIQKCQIFAVESKWNLNTLKSNTLSLVATTDIWFDINFSSKYNIFKSHGWHITQWGLYIIIPL